MKLINKLTALFITVMMLLSFSVMAVQAADEITVTIGSASGVVGETVSVPITISEESFMVSGAFCVEYNSDYLEFTGYTEGDIAEISQYYAQKTVVGTDAVGVIFSTENPSVTVEEAGTVIYLNFTILDCPTGIIDLNVNLVRPDEVTVEGGIADNDGIIDAKYNNGWVEVVSKANDNTKINYSISYDGIEYSDIVSAERSENGAFFKSASCDFDHSYDNVYIKYDIQSDGITGTPCVEISNIYGFWTQNLDDDFSIKVPMYVIGFDSESQTSITLKFVANNGTNDLNDDKNISFVITSDVSDSGNAYISGFIDAEITSVVMANNGSADYDSAYNIDIYYTEDITYNLCKTKIWVSENAPDEYTYDFETCELINSEITGKNQYTDVTFNVYPDDASVILGGKTIKAVNGVVKFNNIATGQQSYKVTAEGYKTAEGTVNVTIGMADVNVDLEFNPYASVKFNVTPHEAEVNFNNETCLAINGVAEFKDVAFGSYEYTITYPGYSTYTGTLLVDSSVETVVVELEKIITSTNVTFNVTPADAAVTLNGVTINAVDGVALFEDVEFGKYTYSVAKEGFVTATAQITVESDMEAVTVVLEEEITSTNVTFNVTPADAAVTLNGVTINAVDGVALFEDVEFGTYTYSVAKEGFVTATAQVTVELDMEAVTVVLEEEVAEPETAPVPELVGLRTYATSYDEATQTITATAIDTNSTAGIAIVIEGAVLKQYTTDSGNGISVSAGGDYKYFVAKKGNGISQTFNIYYTDAAGNKYTYVVKFTFIADPSIVGFKDIVTLRVNSVEYFEGEKKIEANVDSKVVGNLNKGNFGIAIVTEDGVGIEYNYVSDNGGEGSTSGFTSTNADVYTSYKTGENWEATGGGVYGKQNLKMFKKTNGTRMYVDVKLTKGEYSTTYKLVLKLTDVAYEGDVNVTGILPLRADADSFIVDNKAKTIYFETTTANTSAGFAVKVDVQGAANYKDRPRRQLTAVSGYNLSHGPIDNTTNQNIYDRYVVARLAVGLEQTFEVKVHGGADGLAYTIYTVTVKFNRVYQGDIEFADVLTSNVDRYEFDDVTNTFTVYYTGEKAAIALTNPSGSRIFVDGTAAYIDGYKGLAANVANGETQTGIITFKVVNDTTDYIVNFIHQ